MPAARRPGVGGRGEGVDRRRASRRSSAAPVSDPIAGRGDQQHAAADPGHRAGLPDQPDQGAQPRAARWSRAANTLVSPSTPWISATAIAATPAHCSRDRASNASIQYCMVMRRVLAPVNTVVYGGAAWNEHDRSTLREGLARPGTQGAGERGFTALKAEPLAKAMGVSRGSFYWHFADIGAFHAAILERWREVAAEQIIADVEAAAKDDDPLRAAAAPGVRRAAGAGKGGPQLGHRRSRGPRRRAGDRSAPAELCRKPVDAGRTCRRKLARARAQILYWAFLGFALSDQPLPKRDRQAVLDELLRMASPTLMTRLRAGMLRTAASRRLAHECLARTPRRHRRSKAAGDSGVPDDQGSAGIRLRRGRN